VCGRGSALNPLGELTPLSKLVAGFEGPSSDEEKCREKVRKEGTEEKGRQLGAYVKFFDWRGGATWRPKLLATFLVLTI